jgi:hypothetical protein
MLRPILIKRLVAIVALAFVGLSLSGCSMLNKRQATNEPRPPTTGWSLKYERPSDGN